MAVPKDEEELSAVVLPKTPSQPSAISIDHLHEPVGSSTPKQVQSDIVLKATEPEDRKPMPAKRKKETTEEEKITQKPPK